MSRLLDKLTKLRQAEPQPMGFALSRAASENLGLQLLAYLSAENVDKFTDSSGSADALVMEVTKSDDIGSLEKLCRLKDGTPVGGWIKASSASIVKKALNIASDFVIFPAATQLNAIPKDKSGRILDVDPSWTEGMLRTVNDLPVEAVLIGGKDSEITITINRLMLLQRLIYTINKPILAFLPTNVTETELQTLWDLGISGIVVEISDAESAKGLSNLHHTIEKLAPPAFRKKGRVRPILPRLSVEEPQTEEGDEEEDE